MFTCWCLRCLSDMRFQGRNPEEFYDRDCGLCVGEVSMEERKCPVGQKNAAIRNSALVLPGAG